MTKQVSYRLAAVLACGWIVLCLFWNATDAFYNHQFWPWMLTGLAIIGLGTIGAGWALEQGSGKAPEDNKSHQQ